MSRYYLDYNASAPVHPKVIETVAATMSIKGNASSVHAEGRGVKAIVENAREQLRQFINGPVNGVIFTSGGTESIHYALHGSVCTDDVGEGNVKRIFVSAIEHPAVFENAATTGVPVEIIPALKSGLVDLDWLKARLEGYNLENEGRFLVCLMLANNETGVIQPVAEAAAIIHDAGGLIFVDAAQAAGKIPVNFVMLGADMMAMTGHKFGGPIGVGALIIRPNLALEPVMRGGGHEMNRRAGTSNVPAIAGFGKACELAAGSLAKATEIKDMRDQMQKTVQDHGAHVWGNGCDRLPGTLCFSAPGFSSETQVMALDLEGVAVSSGSACSSGKASASKVLLAMGVEGELVTSMIRVSLGATSTQEDVDGFIRAWTKAYARVQERGAA